MPSDYASADEDVILGALRARLSALPAAALRARLSALPAAVLRALAEEGFAPDVHSLMRAEPAAPGVVQYFLGCVLQKQQVAGGPFGTPLECEEEARAWFLLAAHYGHAPAHEAVALHFLCRACENGALTFALPCCYHDACWYLWRGARLGAAAINSEMAALLVQLVNNESHKQMHPLAVHGVQPGVPLSGEERQAMIRLLHLGHRLKDAAGAPHHDAAAQFLLAMQHLGAPEPLMTVSSYAPGEGLNVAPRFVHTLILYMLRAKPHASVAEAQRLLQRSAAQRYAPAIAFLAAVADDEVGAPFAIAAPRALGELPDELAYMLREQRQFCSLLSDLPTPTGAAAQMSRKARDAVTKARVAALNAAMLSQTGNNEEVRMRSTTVHSTTPRSQACALCGRRDVAVKWCARCTSVAYCSKECQTQAWKQGHKRECAAMTAARAEAAGSGGK